MSEPPEDSGDTKGYSERAEILSDYAKLAEQVHLHSDLELLTEKEKKVVKLYYYEDLTLKEISSILEVSESRVSQLHTKALKKIKEQLGDSVDLLSLF